MQTLADRCRNFFAANLFARAVSLQRKGKVELTSTLAAEASAEICDLHSDHRFQVELHWKDSSDGTSRFTPACSCKPQPGRKGCVHVLATILELDEKGYGPYIAQSAVSFAAAKQIAPAPCQPVFPIGDSSSNGQTAAAADDTERSEQPLSWFVFDLNQSLTDEAICIFQLFEPLNSSSPTEPEHFVSANPLTAEETELMQAAEELMQFADTAPMPISLNRSPRANHWTLRAAQSGPILKALSATGRFTWRLSVDDAVDTNRILAWDDNEPWRLQLHLRPTDDGYELTGELARNNETRPLEEPIVLFGDPGFVFFEDGVAGFDGVNHFNWVAWLRRTPTVEIPASEIDTFLTNYHQLAHPPAITLPENLRWEETHCEPVGCLDLQSRKANEPFVAELSYDYDGARVIHTSTSDRATNAAKACYTLRSAEHEKALFDQLTSLGVVVGSSVEEFSIPRAFFADVVESLLEQGWKVRAEGRTLKQSKTCQLSVASKVDWFEMKGEIEFDGATLELPALLAAIRKGERFVALGDGETGILPEDWLRRFAPLADLADDVDGSTRFEYTQVMLVDALLNEFEDVNFDAKFQRQVKKLASFTGFSPRKQPRTFRGDLRAYQCEGLGWLSALQKLELGGILADDMGLGKTIQVLALLETRRTRRMSADQPRKPSIVVAPKSLIFNWLEEAQKFTPKLRIVDYTGPDRFERIESLTDVDVIITTYGTLARDIVSLRETGFDYAILDEAQAIKNAASQRAKACRLLQADHRLAMTGTPVENHLGELWSIFEFLNPRMLGRLKTFQARFTQTAEHQNQLARGLRPFVLRRTKMQVLDDLPEKTEQTLFCQMSEGQRKQYDELRTFYRKSLQDRIADEGMGKTKIHVLEALLRLRQAACHTGLLDPNEVGSASAKVDSLVERLEEVVAEGHKALIFSQFTKLLSIVKTRLEERGIVNEYLDGQTRNRKACVDRFQNDDSVSAFLISLKAGGQGLNLTAADYVFILDPWWNPAVESQAVDRAHRIGQTKPVFAYRLICSDTVEEKILEMQKSKRDLAEAIITADNSVLKNLTTEDLQMLLG